MRAARATAVPAATATRAGVDLSQCQAENDSGASGESFPKKHPSGLCENAIRIIAP
jgi:hypothetical protein